MIACGSHTRAPRDLGFPVDADEPPLRPAAAR